MPESANEVTAAEISRLAGVTRATVSNWRRRHQDFPAPTGGTDTSPTYELDAVRAWLSERGQLPEATPEVELRILLRGGIRGSGLVRQLLPLVPPLAHLAPSKPAELADVPDEAFSAELTAVLRGNAPRPSTVPDPAAQALLRCIDARGVDATLDLLAEHLVGDAATGTYPTPRSLADLMVALPASVKSTFDPACGSGRLLAAAARAGAASLLGQEIIEDQADLAQVRVKVAAPVGDVRAGDSLRADRFADLRADAVVCNPPFGVRDWGHNELAYDDRWVYGLPPRGESELAWAQHCVAHLRENGTAVLLMPPGAAERASGRRVRAGLVRAGALRAVIALPQGAAYPLHLGLQLWVLATPSDLDPPPVLFVDTASAPDRNGRRDFDWPALSEQVLTAWRAFREDPGGFAPEPGVSRSRSVVELLDDTVDLTPHRHVRVAAVVKPDRHDARVHELRNQLRRTGNAMLALSDGQWWQLAGAEPESWRTATVADLLRGGALTLHRTTPAHGTAGADIEKPARMLTQHDVRTGEPPSSSQHEKPVDKRIPIEQGDVMLPETGYHPRPITARVANGQDAGSILGTHLFLLRPDPDRLDADFLAGFLSTDENVHGATVGTSIQRLDIKRLCVPLLPLERQRHYGHAFRRARALHRAADLAAKVAHELADQWAVGLTAGALLPTEVDPRSRR